MGKSNQKQFKKRKIDHHKVDNLLKQEISKIKRPRQKSLIVSGVWMVLLIVFAIVMHYVNNFSFAWNFGLAFILGIAITFVWALLRLGLLESLRLRAHNWRSKRLSKAIGGNSDAKMTVDQYRKFNNQRSWVGIYCMFFLSLFGLVVCVMVYYL